MMDILSHAFDVLLAYTVMMLFMLQAYEAGKTKTPGLLIIPSVFFLLVAGELVAHSP